MISGPATTPRYHPLLPPRLRPLDPPHVASPGSPLSGRVPSQTAGGRSGAPQGGHIGGRRGGRRSWRGLHPGGIQRPGWRLTLTPPLELSGTEESPPTSPSMPCTQPRTQPSTPCAWHPARPCLRTAPCHPGLLLPAIRGCSLAAACPPSRLAGCCVLPIAASDSEPQATASVGLAGGARCCGALLQGSFLLVARGARCRSADYRLPMHSLRSLALDSSTAVPSEQP